MGTLRILPIPDGHIPVTDLPAPTLTAHGLGFFRDAVYFLLWDSFIPSGYIVKLYSLLEYLTSSQWMEGLRQYGINSLRYDGAVVTPDLPQGAISQYDVVSHLSRYLLPSRVVIVVSNMLPELDVPYFGYHGVDDNGCPYCIIPWPSEYANDVAFDIVCETVTHELAEALLDSPPGLGWYSENPAYESNDAPVCAYNPATVQVGTDSYKVGRYWSNADNACWAEK